MRCAVYFSGHTAFAGSVQHACLSAGSSKANYRVCRCIQSAADATLNVKDQSLAASIIRNPDNVTEIKSSKRRNHALFMERYSQFGELAWAFCS
jgi:2-methylcitrate dehydratase PrpD